MDRTIRVWESEVNKANEESKQWKNMFTESAKHCFVEKYQKFELEKELEDSTSKYVDLYLEFEEKKMECEVLNTKFVEAEKQLENCKCKCHGLSMELKEKKMECVGPEDEKNLMLTNVGMICSPSNPPGSNPTSLQGNFEDARVSGTHHLDYQGEVSEGIKDEKSNICFDSMVDFVIADRQQLGFETNESSRQTLVLLKQGDIRTSSTCIIDISDDEVMEICDSDEDGM